MVTHGRARSRKPPKPKVQRVQFDAARAPEEGQLQPIAARVLMKVLYAARMCRFDLMRAVCVLATRITRWDSSCDRRLHRLMSYVHSSLHKRLVGWVGDPLADLQPHVFCDADLAGCADTQRSTTGVYHCVRGAHSSFPIAAVSKRQGSVSHSTPEAELVALDHGLRNVALPSMEVWEVLLPHARLVAHEDNAVAVRVCQTGRNQTMRTLGRTHGITVAWLHEAYKRGQFELRWENSSTMAADIFTKPFSVPLTWEGACALINICAEADIEAMCARAGMPPLTVSGGGQARRVGR